jgi:hypothetical protein
VTRVVADEHARREALDAYRSRSYGKARPELLGVVRLDRPDEDPHAVGQSDGLPARRGRWRLRLPVRRHPGRSLSLGRALARMVDVVLEGIQLIGQCRVLVLSRPSPGG